MSEAVLDIGSVGALPQRPAVEAPIVLESDSTQVAEETAQPTEKVLPATPTEKADLWYATEVAKFDSQLEQRYELLRQNPSLQPQILSEIAQIAAEKKVLNRINSPELSPVERNIIDYREQLEDLLTEFKQAFQFPKLTGEDISEQLAGQQKELAALSRQINEIIKQLEVLEVDRRRTV